LDTVFFILSQMNQSEKAVLETHNKNSVAQKLLTILTEHNWQIHIPNYMICKNNTILNAYIPIYTCYKIKNYVKKHEH